MQNVKFVSSSCFSKLLEAHGCWLLDLAPSCEAPFDPSHWLFLFLVCNSSCSQFELLMFLVSSSFCSWSKLLLLVVCNSSCCWFIAPLGLSQSSFCSQLVALFVPSWQLFLLLIGSSSFSQSLAILGHGPTLLALGLQFFLIMVKAPFNPSSQLLLLLVYSSF